MPTLTIVVGGSHQTLPEDRQMAAVQDLAAATGESFHRLRTWLYNHRFRQRTGREDMVGSPQRGANNGGGGGGGGSGGGGNGRPAAVTARPERRKAPLPAGVVPALERMYLSYPPNSLMARAKELAVMTGVPFPRLRTWMYVRTTRCVAWVWLCMTVCCRGGICRYNRRHRDKLRGTQPPVPTTEPLEPLTGAGELGPGTVAHPPPVPPASPRTQLRMAAAAAHASVATSMAEPPAAPLQAVAITVSLPAGEVTAAAAPVVVPASTSPAFIPTQVSAPLVGGHGGGVGHMPVPLASSTQLQAAQPSLTVVGVPPSAPPVAPAPDANHPDGAAAIGTLLQSLIDAAHSGDA